MGKNKSIYNVSKLVDERRTSILSVEGSGNRRETSNHLGEHINYL